MDQLDRSENIAVAHPAIAEAAVIGVRHPKWDERPLVIAVRKPGASVTREDLLGFYTGKVAKWWMPDDVVFVDQLPHTATGKLLKTKLRQDSGLQAAEFWHGCGRVAAAQNSPIRPNFRTNPCRIRFVHPAAISSRSPRRSAAASRSS